MYEKQKQNKKSDSDASPNAELSFSSAAWNFMYKNVPENSNQSLKDAFQSNFS